MVKSLYNLSTTQAYHFQLNNYLIRLQMKEKCITQPFNSLGDFSVIGGAFWKFYLVRFQLITLKNFRSQTITCVKESFFIHFPSESVLWLAMVNKTLKISINWKFQKEIQGKCDRESLLKSS